MAKHSLNGVLHHVRVLAAVQTDRGLADPVLLKRFIEQNDEAAFTVLIERHGPMVLGVCRRALQHTQDAEDACQATFLVFARKARSIRKRASLGSWLHGIACRIAANLRRQRARRQKREQRRAPPATPADVALQWREVQMILDEELQQLPERHRAPLLLCYWQGKTRDEAAGELGLSTGKLHGLLERGRDLLRERLTQRGLTLSAALCASFATAEAAPAAVSPTLVVSATKAALTIAAGQSLSPNLVSSQVLALTKEVLTGMFLTKLKVATASVLVVGLAAALVAGSLATPGLAQNPPAQGKSADAFAKSETDDAFIRRMSKDLRGVDPTPAEVHFFVHNQDAGKRQKLIDLFIQERQAKQKHGDADSLARSVALTLRRESVNVRTVIKLPDDKEKASSDSLAALRAQLEAELKQTQAALEALKAQESALLARRQAMARFRVRAVLAQSLIEASPSVVSLQNTFFRSLIGSSDEKKSATKAVQDYRDSLLKYLEKHPKAADAPDAMLQIEMTYRAQGKTVEADAWRTKLKEVYPDSPAAKHRIRATGRVHGDVVGEESIAVFFEELQVPWERLELPVTPPEKK